MTTAAYQVAGLLDKMTSTDKDFRFMAISDLTREIQNNMKLDNDTERKVVHALIRLIEDSNGEVQNLAVKCIGVMSQRMSEPQADFLIDALCRMIGDSKQPLRDVSSIALKTVVGSLPPASNVMSAKIVKCLMPKLLTAINQAKEIDSTRTEILDIIGDVLLRFGAAVESHHIATKNLLLAELNSDRQTVRKRATVALGYLSAICDLNLYNDMTKEIVGRLSKASGASAMRATVLVLTQIARLSPSRFTACIKVMVPMVMKIIKETEDDELREGVLQLFEALYSRCSDELTEFMDSINAILLENLSYDPNYSYDDGEDEDSMEVENDSDGDGDDGEYSDDDDTSWKVRRSAAKAIEAVIVARRELLQSTTKTFGPVLIQRLREREDNVRSEIFSAYMALLRQARTIIPNINSVFAKDGMAEGETVRIGNVSYLRPHLSQQQVAVLEILATQREALLKAISRQLKEKSPKIRHLAFQLVAELVRTLANGIEGYFGPILSGVKSAMDDKSSGAQMKVDALTFISFAFASHSAELWTPHLDVLTTVIANAINDSFYKVSAEGLALMVNYVDMLTQTNAGADIATKLYDPMFAKLKCTDVDQEVKDRSIIAAGKLLASFSDRLSNKTDECEAVLLERLRAEMSRVHATRAFTMLAASDVDLSRVLAPLLVCVADFVKKHVRVLRIASLKLIQALIARKDAASAAMEFDQIFAILPTLVDDGDLQVTQLALSCMSDALQKMPDIASPHVRSLLKSIVLLSQSPLVQGASLVCVQHALESVVKCDADRTSFETLLDMITAPVYDNANLPRQSFHSISTLAAVVASNTNDKSKAQSLAKKLAQQLSNDSSNDAIRLFSVHAIGELGRRCPEISSAGDLRFETLILSAFNSPSEEVKTAAAQALGALGVGNLDKYLPFILAELEAQPKRQYLLLHALKEVIAYEYANKRSDQKVVEVWPNLVSLADCPEEGTRNVVSECLGRLCLLNIPHFLPKLKELVKSPSANVRCAAISALKCMISEEKDALSSDVKHSIGDFMRCVADADLNVRRVTLVTLNSAAHNKPSLIRDLLTDLLPAVYEETMVKKELIREVEMGPFKHTVDDGVDLRKTAFECMYTLLDSCLEKLEIFEFISYMENGLKDLSHDVKLLTYLMLAKLAVLCPAQVLQRLDKICEPLKQQLMMKSKPNAVKQEVDKQEELKRAVIRVVLAIQRVPDADRQQQIVDIQQIIRHSDELRAMNEAIIKDSQRSFVGEPMET